MADLMTLRNSFEWLVITFVAATFSIFFAYYIFPTQASILAISFLVVALTPHFYSLLESEEMVVAHGPANNFIQRYDSLFLKVFVIAVGIFLAFSFWYYVLPSDPEYGGVCATSLPCKEAVFSLQSQNAASQRDAWTIFSLMLICFVLSLSLGAGVILIIAWELSSFVVELALGGAIIHIYLPQLIGFFLTGLSGALLSFAIVRHEWRSRAFFVVLKDSLLVLGLSLLIIAASFL